MAEPDATASPPLDSYPTRRQFHASIAILICIVLALFGDLLFLPGDEVLSHPNGDTAQNHIFLRDVGFQEIRNGNLPLWNPYIFSGTPFLGSMQAALTYPPNIIYLFLPIAKAINFDMAAHLLLLGIFTVMWLNRWRMHWLASTYGAVTVMLCGGIFLRILAGQINVLANMTWFPLLLLSVDHIVDDTRRDRFPSPWCIVGIVSTALMIYAGYPQALFICAVCTGIYTLARFVQSGVRATALLELSLVAGLPLFLGAIQLWTGIATGMESIRGSDMTYEFGSTYSFPPEAISSLLVPSFFGDVMYVWPWGRWGFWDVSVFIGVVGLFLVLNSFGREHVALRRIAWLLIAFTLLVALGRYTPVHQMLFDHVPGFNKFRAPSKFLLVTSYFLAALTGVGAHNLIHHPKRGKALGLISIALGASIVVSAVVIFLHDPTDPEGHWWALLKSYENDPDAFFWLKLTSDYAAETAAHSRLSMFASGGTALLCGALLYFATKKPKLVYGVLTLGIIELFIFAYAYRASFSIDEQMPKTLSSLVGELKPDERLLTISGIPINSSNMQMAYRAQSTWGYDPVILERYAVLLGGLVAGRANGEMLTDRLITHGSEPVMTAMHSGLFRFTDAGTTYNDNLFQLLRCRAILKLPTEERWASFMRYARKGAVYGLYEDRFIRDEVEHIHWVDNPVPRLFAVSQFAVSDDYNTILNILADDRFNPHEHLVLEEEPVPPPQGLPYDVTITVLDESTDHITLKVETPTPTILVITDAYAKGWKVTAFEDSVQDSYRIQPANLAFRAIPLEAGAHHFRMEYRPAIYDYARTATGVSVMLLLALIVICIWRNRSAKLPSPV